MKELIERLPSGLRVSGPVVVSGLAVAISATVVFYGVRSLFDSVAKPSVTLEEADPLATLATESSEFLEASRKRFEGRSMYALPPAPVRKPKVVERPKPVEPPKDPGPPPAPATYTGPAPSSVFGDYVIFSSLSDVDKRIKVGETKAGVTVVAVNAPYSTTLKHMGKEYVVDLWPRINESFLRGGLPASRVTGMTEVSGTTGVPGVAQGPNAQGPNAQGPNAGSNTTPGSPIGPTSGASGAGSPLGTPPNGQNPANAGPNANPTAGLGGPNGDSPATAAPTAIPSATPNGTGGGASVGGPALPSPAMAPQRLPTPAPSSPQGSSQGSPQGSANDPEAESPAGETYVDRSLLPAPLSAEAIAAMSVPAAQRALRAIEATASWNVDDHSRARLNHERDLLQARIARGG